MNDINLVSIFTIALLSSLGHCVGMCGGIVVLYSRFLSNYSYAAKMLRHVLYSLGRITTYCLIGGISSYIGKLLSFNKMMSSLVFIIVGAIMIVLGIGLLIPKITSFIKFNILQVGIFNDLLSILIKKCNNPLAIYFVGILNGMLPCGIVYFFALSASTQDSVFNGVMVMFIFGISTFVTMILFGIFTSFFDFVKYRKLISRISAILIISFGINTIVNGVLDNHAVNDNNHKNTHMMEHH